MAHPAVPTIAIAAGYKFAVLAVPEAGTAPASILSLSPRYAVSSALPDGVLDAWRENIGSLHVAELEKTHLFLWALKKSKAPAILDRENETLAKDAYLLYFGVLLAVPYFSHGRLTSLTGANCDGTPHARSFTFYSRLYRTLGAPHPSLSASRLRLGAQLAAALKKFNRSPYRWRIERSLRAFREACEADRLDQRLHQFVRCAEGFAVPPFGQSAVHFATRLRRLCTGHCKAAMKQLYDMRSGIEHLHGPYDRLPKRPAPGRFQRLLQRCIQAEALSRFLLTVYLLNPGLWPWFKDRDAIQRFWQLSDTQLRALCPVRFAFPSATRVLDRAAVRQHRARA